MASTSTAGKILGAWLPIFIFVSQGFREVYNLRGGIDAWSREVDSGVPRY